MKTAIALCMALGMVGCDGNTYVIGGKPFKKADLSPEQKIEVLRSEAHNRGLHWYIICVPKSDYDEDQHYIAYAEQQTQPKNAIFIEDGSQSEGWRR